MVFSPDLGYDPDEWEECQETEHLLTMSLFTRVCLSVGTIMASLFFFWVLEANKKRRSRGEAVEEEPKRGTSIESETSAEEAVKSRFARASEEAAMKAQPERRRNSKRELTRDEELALLEWEAEVQRVEQKRLRASQEPEEEAEGMPHIVVQEARPCQEDDQIRHYFRPIQVAQQSDQHRGVVFGQTGAMKAQSKLSQKNDHKAQEQTASVQHFGFELAADETESRTIDLLVIGDEPLEKSRHKELLRVRGADVQPGSTPPSTPPGGVPELAAHYRSMADELTRKLLAELAEMDYGYGLRDEENAQKVASELQQRHREQIDGAFGDTGAPQEVRERLARQLETHVAEVVSQELRKRSSSSALLPRGAEEDTEQQPLAPVMKKGSSGDSSDDGFVKIRAPEEEALATACLAEGTALKSALTLTTSVSIQQQQRHGGHGLTPSPQLVTDGEQEDHNVRVSLFSAGEGEGGSTTADDIEFVPSAGASPLPPKSQDSAVERVETEQVLALLQEYDLDQQMKHERVRQIPSGAVSSGINKSDYGGVTSGDVSVPESPGSMGFDFVTFPTPEEESNVGSAGTKEQQQQMVAKLEEELMEEQWTQDRREQMAQSKRMVSYNVAEQIAQQQAEQFLREALDYMDSGQHRAQTMHQQRAERQQKRGSLKSGGSGQSAFVVEEEMLESEDKEEEEEAKWTTKKANERAGTGGGGSTTMATSKQIRTNEAFTRPDQQLLLGFDDVDDKDVTYAPEIQSMEVPPDQLSQADSLNLVDENFSEHEKVPTAETKQGAVEEEKKRRLGMEEENEYAVAHEKREMMRVEEHHQKRELTPREEEQLHRDIDAMRRTPSPHPPKLQPQTPQAPQFLRSYFNDDSTSTSLSSTSMRQSSLLSALGVSSKQEMLLRLTKLEALSEAMRKAGLESSNLIFGIDYTASNKYQGERSFGGRSLHCVESSAEQNPYQQVIKIIGRTLASFLGRENGIPVFGFGDSTTGDWSVFPLNGRPEGECSDLDDVLRVYNEITPNIDLSGPTNFAPLIYRSMEICHKRKDYHILVIIADGQVTNEKATVKAIVGACQYPLSIIVVGVGDGPWEMMRVFDESLPKRPWDNFHFVEFHELVNARAESPESRELAFAVHTLLEIPDQYATIRKLGMLSPAYYTRQPHSPRSRSPRLPLISDDTRKK